LALDTTTTGTTGAGPQAERELMYGLRAQLSRYRKRIRRERRTLYLSLALLGAAIFWLGASLAGYFGLDLPWAFPLAVGATFLLPVLALGVEIVRRPSLAETADIIDRQLDNRQRLVTSVDLLSRQQSETLDAVQLQTTQSLLGRSSPKEVYPVRTPAAVWSWSAGLLLLALGLYVLRGAGGGFSPIGVGSLPPDQPVASVFATATPLSGLPESELTPQPSAIPTSAPTEVALDGMQPAPGDPSAPQTTGPNGSPIDPNSAQDQAAQSQEAQSALDELGEALDSESATQASGDSLKQGDPQSAAEQLRELGEENDQLSDEAKRSLAESLERAADETQGNRRLREAENRAAEALRDGDYRRIKESLERLADALEDTAAQVIPQDQLAAGFPSPTAQPDAQADGGEGETGTGEESASEGGDGQEGENGEGQEGSGSESGSQGSPQQGEGEGEQPGMGGAQSEGGDGQSQTGAPGQGTRVNGPRSERDLDTAGNPFEIPGSPDPNSQGSGDQPGIELEGGGGTSGGALPARPGSTVDAPGENPGLPLDRWDIVRRYFSPESGR
jgi:curved DNA-binding protein CbpA